MKSFKVSAIIKGKHVDINIDATSAECAKQKAMRELGYEMRGLFFPLHWSEIKTIIKL